MVTSSKKTKRLLSILLCLCMVLSILPATWITASAVNMSGGEVLYLKPNSNWLQANARFAAYFYGTGNAWASMTPVEADSGVYKVTVPNGNWTNVIFCRMNPGDTANNWNNKWNQSGDLAYDGTKNLCEINAGQWDCGTNVTWSAYEEPSVEEPPCTHDSHTQEGNCTNCGEAVEHVYVDGFCSCGAEDPTEPVSLTVYCINSLKWAEVSAHAWGGGAADTVWPGIPMTKTEETVNGFDIYEVTFDVAYENVLFNNNNNGSQSSGLELKDGQYYDLKNKSWYASLEKVPVIDPLGTDCYLAGSFNEWNTTANEFKRDAEGSVTGYISLELEANTTYEFKVVREGTWTGCQMTITGDIAGLTFSSSDGYNCNIKTKEAGTYVFAYDLENSQLSVTYPKNPDAPCEHVEEKVEGYPATCTENGLTDGVKCSVCDETLVEQKEIPAEGHKFEDDVCSVCGAAKYMTIYFQNNWLWSDVKLHFWGSAYENDTEWPGASMTFHGNDGTYDCYSMVVPTDVDGIIVTGIKDDGSGGLDKTPNIESGWYDGICYYMTWADGNQTGSFDISDIEFTCRHKDDDDNGLCDACQSLLRPALLRMTSISLKGNIAINYYMMLSDEVLNDESAYMQFTLVNGNVIGIPASDGVPVERDGVVYYVFSCEVNAKEMTDAVLSQFFYEGGETAEHSYTVQTYAKHILENCTDAKAKSLVTAMLNYGAASQAHFGYNTDNLANAGLEAPDYSNVTIDGFKAVAGQGTDLAKLYSASLILKSETTLRFFFKLDSDVENFSVLYGTEPLEIKERGGLYYVDVTGIAAKDLDADITLTINDGASTADLVFNPMSYCQGVQNDTTGAFGENMKNLVAALYQYNLAANNYFEEN